MSRIRELIDGVRQSLAPFGYNDSAAGTIGDVDFMTVLAAPRRSSGKLACAVARIPDDVGCGEEPAHFAERIRRGLARHFPGLPWPKRLGTYTILLGDREQCGRLRDRKGELIDARGLHVNVLLGTVLVDVETFRAYADTTWGLIDTGDQFAHIQKAVEGWCRAHRKPSRMVRTVGQAMSVA